MRIINFSSTRKIWKVSSDSEEVKERHLSRLKVIFSSSTKRTQSKGWLVFRALGYQLPVGGKKPPCLYSLRVSLSPSLSISLSPQDDPTFYAFAQSKSGGSPVKLSVSTKACGDLMNLNPTVFRMGKYSNRSSWVLCV